MADISRELEQIMKARYGRDVRKSIHDGINALNGSAEAERKAAEEAQVAAETAKKTAKDAQDTAVEAQMAAETAQRLAESAQKKAEAAKETADEKAEIAREAAENASDCTTEAESWAHGGTGTRESEDTDNSKYHSEQAKISSQIASEYLNKVEQAGEKAVQAVKDAFDIDAPYFTVDLETGHLTYSGGRFAFCVNKNGHLEWGVAV